jgi:tRNA-guanine family transglycosylase
VAEICIIYQSEDETVVERLVGHLRHHWSVWWARDIPYGDWETAVRREIDRASAVLPVLSAHTKGDRTNIIKDEMAFARKRGKPILPFLIGNAETPFGFGGLNYTSAYGWNGEEGQPGFQELKTKLASAVGGGENQPAGLHRPAQVQLGRKWFALPSFVFSVSSHETQVSPKEGLSLLQFLEPGAVLVSAYDVWKSYRRDTEFRSNLADITHSPTLLFLDSGNYEAYRKLDRYAPRKNPNGWSQEKFWEIARKLTPDIVFAFDTANPKGNADKVADKIIRAFRLDERALSSRRFPLCPVVHLPKGNRTKLADQAADIIAAVASATTPILVAIPERELGDGLIERVKTVRTIRKKLDQLDRYYPLHLLGTGNPLSMVSFATAGADLFDGLEWCRTIADYGTGFLFHFQHFDCFKETLTNRIQDERVRSILEDSKASYAEKALSYNVDYFKDANRTMQNMIGAGQTRTLINNLVPNISTALLRVASE